MAKLRVGIVGAGNRGIDCFGHMFRNYHSDQVVITALADPNMTRARIGLESLGIEAAVHASAEELAARKDIDAVVVTTPDHVHEEAALAALRHKKHVLVDKPLATSVDGCMRILEAAAGSGKLLYMGFNLRHHAVIQNLRKMSAEGRFGDIFSITAMEHYDGGRTYHSRWNRLRKFSGGLWLHKGSHDFDVINHLMGSVRPARVSCFASVFTLRPERLPFRVRDGIAPGPNCTVCAYNTECKDAYLWPAEGPGRPRNLFTEETAKVDGYYKNACMYLSDKDTHDQGVAIIEYENGATATHTECFVTPLTRRWYSIDGTAGHGEASLEDYRVDFQPRWSQDLISHRIHRPAGGHGGADPVMVADFVACATTGRRPMADAVDGIWSVAVACAAEKSRDTRRAVDIADLMDTKSRLVQPRT